MHEIPSIVIHFHQPKPDDRVPITLTTVGGANENGWINLPFALALVPLLLRALNARQYPDYPNSERFFRGDDDRVQIITALRSLDLWEGTTEAGAIPIDVHARFGRMLGASLLAEQTVSNCLETLYNLTIAQGKGEIIFKFDPDAMMLAALPWEVTHIGRQPVLLNQGTVLSCSRVITFPHPLPAPRRQGERLRVLTLAPDAGFPSIHRKFEQQARQRLAAELQGLPIDIEHLSPVTMKDLQRRLDQGPSIDVLDYYGHGRFKDGIGALLLDGSTSIRDWAEASRLATLPNLPHIIVLHACQSAQEDTTDPLAGVATALSYAGVRAVVAMQLTTRMSAATDFIAPAIYRKLAAGWDIQRAVAVARQALYAAEHDGASWYLPAIYLRLQELQALRLIEAYSPPSNPFAGVGALGDPSQIIGRDWQQQRLYDRLRCRGNLSIIGPAGSGKTTLLNMIAAQAKALISPDVLVVSLIIHENLKRLDAERELIDMIGEGKTRTLQRLLQGRHLIILLDDLGRLKRDNHGMEVRQWLRSLSHNRSQNTVVQLVASSQRPLHEIFAQDRPVDGSPLHDSMRDFINLSPFTEIEARRFIASRLQGTPFRNYEFEAVLKASLIPGTLQDACRELYDTLSQQLEQ